MDYALGSPGDNIHATFEWDQNAGNTAQTIHSVTGSFAVAADGVVTSSANLTRAHTSSQASGWSESSDSHNHEPNVRTIDETYSNSADSTSEYVSSTTASITVIGDLVSGQGQTSETMVGETQSAGDYEHELVTPEGSNKSRNATSSLRDWDFSSHGVWTMEDNAVTATYDSELNWQSDGTGDWGNDISSGYNYTLDANGDSTYSAQGGSTQHGEVAPLATIGSSSSSYESSARHESNFYEHAGPTIYIGSGWQNVTSTGSASGDFAQETAPSGDSTITTGGSSGSSSQTVSHSERAVTGTGYHSRVTWDATDNFSQSQDGDSWIINGVAEGDYALNVQRSSSSLGPVDIVG